MYFIIFNLFKQVLELFLVTLLIKFNLLSVFELGNLKLRELCKVLKKSILAKKVPQASVVEPFVYLSFHN